MRLSERRLAQLALLGIVALAVTVVSVAAATGGDASRPVAQRASWSGLVGGPRPEVPVGQRMIVVLRTPSLAGWRPRRTSDAGRMRPGRRSSS
jgi:hypothetical protein